MSSNIFTQQLLVFLLAFADFTYSKVHYYFTPSLDVSCPHDKDPCLTLSQFAANFSSYLGNETDISLFFLPGNHSLDRDLSLTHADNISMTKDSRDNGTAFIECVSPSGKFGISEINFASISSLHFISCGGNTVTQVEQFTLEGTIFQDVKGRGTALVLNEVTTATIVRSSFLSNTDGRLEQHMDFPAFEHYLQCLEENIVLNVPVSNGGALYAAFSNVWIEDTNFDRNRAELFGAAIAIVFGDISITNSQFVHNKAEVGGVLLAYNSSLHIVNSSFANNSACDGGVMLCSSGSSSSITNCTFSNNSAVYDGGVVALSESSLNIANSSFIGNSASNVGGVMIIRESPFTITSSTFTNNVAALGGVMHTSGSSFNIAKSSFTNNSAAFAGGVMFTREPPFMITNGTFTNNSGGFMDIARSSFNITDGTFTNNNAAFGGVIHTTGSLFNIAKSFFTGNGASIAGGVMFTSESPFTITNSTFTNNSADDRGGVMDSTGSSFTVAKSKFTGNYVAGGGGVMITTKSSFNIISSTFANNIAVFGGVMDLTGSSLNIVESVFTGNGASIAGGVMFTSESPFTITNSTFTNNSADDRGGVMDSTGSSFTVAKSKFTGNYVAGGGGVMITTKSSFNIISSTFTDNYVTVDRGGVMDTFASVFNITSSTFTNNNADYRGGVMYMTSGSSFNISHSTFTSNSAARGGVVCYSQENRVDIIINNDKGTVAVDRGGIMNVLGSLFNNSFTNNSADIGGVMYAISDPSLYVYTSYINTNINNAIDIDFTNISTAIHGELKDQLLHFTFSFVSSTFSSNTADHYGGIMVAIACSVHITDTTFDYNLGSLYIFNGNLTLSGYNKFVSCMEPLTKADNVLTRPEGGAITSFQSNVIFTGVSRLLNNQARHGGAILATESTLVMYGEVTIANNAATNSSGGGIYLQQSDLEIRQGICNISNNYATRGGGIHASSSPITVYQQGALQIIHNTAENGGGIYLEINPKLYLLKSMSKSTYRNLMTFTGNHANYGGALYVADDTNSAACSHGVECFIQTLALYQQRNADNIDNTVNIFFSENTATAEHGSNLFGGLLSRCTPSTLAEVYQFHFRTAIEQYNGVTYLESISNIPLDSIASLPSRVCFCNSEGQPDCSYQPLPIIVKKGETFTVSLVAVDQVNHPVSANITSSLTSPDGGFDEGQQTQKVNKNCTDLVFNVFSPGDTETITLFADGPCKSSTSSKQYVKIQFLNCTCPVGFKPSNRRLTRCECICDSALTPFITNCNYANKSLLRVNTNSWLTYINDTDPPGYVIHPNCPFDYCHSPGVIISFSLPNGVDTQCAHNRRGVLCGACQENLSLSLGSSQCLPCHHHWLAVFVAILLAAIIAGIVLVTVLLALNITVAVGLINSFLFYANIAAANSSVFFPSSKPSFPTVFVSWLNLDIGIDVCFFDGFDAYTKIWLQLTFPAYIISLVVIVIIVSEYSSRFAGLIGKRDPIATLATLILLSYAKLLSVTIAALSFAVLHYPDGSQDMVWLPDGNVKYFRGKHIALVIVVVFIILIGVPYTVLLFLWQWLVQAPRWKIFKWTRNTKLNAFIATYHAPYNSKYRYWTGLLLVVRVVLYITAAVTVSANPQTSLLVTSILVGGLFLLKGSIGVRVYKKSPVDVVETVMYFNILILSVFSFYDFKIDTTKQISVAYTSTIITFLLLVGVVIYHVTLLIKKDKTSKEVNEYPLAPVQSTNSEVTHSIVEIPKPQCPPPEISSNMSETIQEHNDCRIISFPYQ